MVQSFSAMTAFLIQGRAYSSFTPRLHFWIKKERLRLCLRQLLTKILFSWESCACHCLMMVYFGPSWWQLCCHKRAMPGQGKAAVCRSVAPGRLCTRADCTALSPGHTQQSLREQWATSVQGWYLGPVSPSPVYLVACGYLVNQWVDLPKAHFVKWFAFQWNDIGWSIRWLFILSFEYMVSIPSR